MTLHDITNTVSNTDLGRTCGCRWISRNEKKKRLFGSKTLPLGKTIVLDATVGEIEIHIHRNYLRYVPMHFYTWTRIICMCVSKQHTKHKHTHTNAHKRTHVHTRTHTYTHTHTHNKL